MSRSRPINLRTLAQELNKLNSIVEKLDYLENRHKSSKNISSNNYTLHQLVEKMPIKHFPDKINDPEFNYWFLQYNARGMLKNYIDGHIFKNDDSSQLKKRELGIINKLENKANELNDTGVISRLHKYSIVGYLDYFKEDNLGGYSKIEIIETLRVLDKQHYRNNPTPHLYSDIFSAEVFAYFIHILLKDFLIQSLDSKNETVVKKFEDHFFKLNNRELFFTDLRTTFNVEKGLTFGILIHWLKQQEVLIIGHKEFKNFCIQAQEFFVQDIKSREAILKYDSDNEKQYQEENRIITNKLSPIIALYKATT
jgi:hypothetical protein